MILLIDSRGFGSKHIDAMTPVTPEHQSGRRFLDWLEGLVARFDERLLQASFSPEAPSVGIAMLDPEQARAFQALHGWCFVGAGSGRSPFGRPWAMPSVERRCSVAVLTGDSAVRRSLVAEALCRELDGSLLLAACSSRVAGLALRLRVKLADATWWRTRREADPWDSGYLRADSNVTGALAGFAPRRATLIVMLEPSDDLLGAVIAQLGVRSAGFRHPLRLLIVAATPPTALALERKVGRGDPLSRMFSGACPGEVTMVALERPSRA